MRFISIKSSSWEPQKVEDTIPGIGQVFSHIHDWFIHIISTSNRDKQSSMTPDIGEAILIDELGAPFVDTEGTLDLSAVFDSVVSPLEVLDSQGSFWRAGILAGDSALL